MSVGFIVFDSLSSFARMNESGHWAIQFGDYDISLPELLSIKDCNMDMSIILRMLFNIYFSSLSAHNVRMAAQILSLVPQIIDPYIPSICYEVGIDNSNDEYLDKIDGSVQSASGSVQSASKVLSGYTV